MSKLLFPVFTPERNKQKSCPKLDTISTIYSQKTCVKTILKKSLIQNVENDFRNQKVESEVKTGEVCAIKLAGKPQLYYGIAVESYY